MNRINRIFLSAVALMVLGSATAVAQQMPVHKHVSGHVRAAEQVITNVEGEATYYDRVSLGWYIYAGGNNLQYGPITGTAKVVVSDDGFAYMQNPLTADKRDSYIKCTLEGNKLRADFPQQLATLQDISGDLPLYIGMLKLQQTEEGITYVPVESDNYATWTINEDGIMTFDHEEVPMTDNGRFAGDLPQTILGTYYYSGGEPCWNAVGDWYQKYKKIETEEILQIPEGLVVQPWELSSKKANRTVDIAIDGTDIYIGRLTDYAEGAIKGTIKGRKVSFPTQQYMGFNEQQNANVWFISAKAEYETYDFGGGVTMDILKSFNRTDALEFTYNAEAKTLTSLNDDCYLINAMKDETNFYEYQENPCLAYLEPEGMDAKPQNPVITNPGEDKGDDGYYFECEIPAVNVNGVRLNTDRMYYNIYVNGELHTFYRDTYSHFGADITDVPYNYYDNWDVTVSGTKHGIYFHAEGINEVAVQSFFRGSDGTIYSSDLITTAVPYDKETTFAYASKDEAFEPCGTGRHETYDIAVALTNPALAGKQITAIEIPLYPTTRVSDVSVWIADVLKVELIDGKNVNVVNKSWSVDMPTTGDMQFVTVELDKPYTIPSVGTYVGYSLTVDEINNADAATQIPIVASRGAHEGGFWLHTSRSFLEWKDRSEELGVTALTQVHLAGDFQLNAVTFGNNDAVYVPVDTEQPVTLKVHNVGINPISSMDYTLEVAGKQVDQSIEFAEPIPAVFAIEKGVEFTLPAIARTGDYTAQMKITKVNGMPNDAEASAAVDVKVLAFVPKHNSVVEEYTGTWCGWCSRGYAAMEYMSEHYPDFIGIAYHDSDPMEMRGGYPVQAPGFPNAQFDRTFMSDPFYSKGDNNGFKLPETWQELCSTFVPVGVDVSAVLTDEGTVDATSNVEWVMQPEGDKYRVEYILVADGLKGRGQSWWQHNYYAFEPKEQYLEFFCDAEEYVKDLEFNDVAILTTGFDGVDGSIESASVGHKNVYTHSFNLADVKNVYNQSIPYSTDKLRVVALLLDLSDTETYPHGRVVNAAKCVVGQPGSVGSLATDATILSETWHDLQGRRVANPDHGIYLRTTKYSDGHTTVTKVVR